MIELKLYLEPVPHQSVRAIPKIRRDGQPNEWTAFNMFHQPKRIIQYKKDLRNLIKEQLPENYKIFSKDIPLIITIDFYFKYRKSEKKALIGHKIPKISKPDISDNLNKAVFDAMEGVVYEQDQQVFDYHARKYWYTGSGIHIKITPLNKGDQTNANNKN